jgi:UDP-N-acetylglucosamine--dolichyl-phosphate N-acetylglucosaminephosphotransferase
MIPQFIKAFLIFLVPFFLTLYFMPLFIRKAKKRRLVVKDMYKPGQPKLPNLGGLVMLASTFIGLVAAQFFIPEVETFYIFYFIVFSFALYGLADDLLGFVKRNGKVLVLFIVALPIALITTDTNISLVFFNVELGALYGLVFAPIYIMVVANLVNMYAGYNGLSLGLTLILMVFAAVKGLFLGQFVHVTYLLPLMGAMAAMMFFNFYPAKALLGNIGAFMMGAGVGGFLVLAGMEFFGVIILIPHIINLFLWIYWSLNMRRFPHIKFAEVNKDGTINPPNMLSMKFLVSRVFRVTEPQAVLICYSITIAFGVLGLVV